MAGRLCDAQEVEPADVIARLCAFPSRGACTDAERRAAVWMRDELRARGHDARVETHWVRPHWAPALALAALLGGAGSLASVAAPLAGAIAAAVAAACLALEALGRSSPLRLLTRRRATQDVLALPPAHDGVTLLVCARYDAPRRGLVLNDGWRALGARVGNPQAVLAGCAAVVAAAAGARLDGVDATWLGAVQLVPTVVLIGALAAALDIATSAFSPGADGAAAAAVALAVHDELAAEAPAALHTGLVLYGAGASGPQALRAHLRRERANRRSTVLLELGPCAGGSPAWSTRHPQLARAVARSAEALGLPAPRRRPHGVRGAGRVPALRIACLDARGSSRAPTSPTTRPSTPTRRRRTGRSTSLWARSTRWTPT